MRRSLPLSLLVLCALAAHAEDYPHGRLSSDVMPLSMMRRMSFGSLRRNLVRQKGCSIQEPQSSWRCIPSRRCLTAIFFSML